MGIFSSRDPVPPRPSLAEMVKRSRILVIDDVRDEFPFEILTAEGYNLHHWADVESLAQLETGEWDIIVLDIGGVGASLDATNQGAGVLHHIKSINPAQVVVAFSGQSHDPQRIAFFEHADAWMPKTASVLEWKEAIDRLLRDRVSFDGYWAILEDLLRRQHVSESRIKKLRRHLAGGVAPIESKATLRDLIGPVDDAVTVLAVIAKIARLVVGVP